MCNYLGMADEYWAALSRHLTSIGRTTHASRTFEAMGTRAVVDVRHHLYLALARLRDLQPVRITDLADVIDTERSTVSRQVAELVSLGLVERSPDPDDGRAVVLSLTDEGEAVMRRIYDAWFGALDEMIGDWSQRDRDKLLTLLQRLDNAITGHFKA